MSIDNIDFLKLLENEESLDPENWDELKTLGHQMVDVMLDFLKNQRQYPAWRKPGDDVKSFLSQELPQKPAKRNEVFNDFVNNILPYAKGNAHPRYWAWVEGGGTPFGMLADMLASGMNPNLGIGDHSAIYVEMQVLNWIKEFLGFSSGASGLLVSGGSVANFTALTVARNSIGEDIRSQGLFEAKSRFTVYASTETHSCVQKSIETLGLGSNSLIKIPVDKDYKIDMVALQKAISADRKRGRIPFCVVGNAATVNTGAIDPLNELAALAKKEKLWFHVDGAFGAFAAVVSELEKEIQGLHEADSVALDLHKWMCMPYETGCVIIKNKELHRKAFQLDPPYLVSHERGLSAGPESFGNYGLQLSRGFRALKVWMSLKEHGSEKYKSIIKQNIAQVKYLEHLIRQSNKLELMAPVSLNIVCFRFNNGELTTKELNTLNREILMTLHERGIAIPSYTFLGNKYVLRVANVNHRSRKKDFEMLVDSITDIGSSLLAQGFISRPMVVD
jgi:aromatic-L-amino-acid decarboxylase